MKLLSYISLTDLLPESKSLVDRLIIEPFSRDYKNAFSGNDLARCLHELKKVGVSGLQLSSPFNISTKQLKRIHELVKVNKAPIKGIHQPLTSLVSISFENIVRLCEIANKLEANYIVLHLDVVDIDKLKKLRQLEEKHQIKIYLENAHKSPLNLSKDYSWDEQKFADFFKENDFKIVFDTTHLAQARGNIIDFFLKNQEKIVDIQISDFKKSFVNSTLLLTGSTHLPLGKGNLPIQEFLKTLKEKNYQGSITMEIIGSIDQLCENARLIKQLT